MGRFFYTFDISREIANDCRNLFEQNLLDLILNSFLLKREINKTCTMQVVGP